MMLGALALIASAKAATDSQPHYHTGKLTPYHIGPPSVLLSSRDEERLRAGRPVIQALVADDGQTRRMIMVQDIAAPSSIVLGRIMDLNSYDRMVSGVDQCVTYASHEDSGLRTVKSTYEISAAHMKFKYFVEHTFDPKAQCMVFRLDYDRRSDLDDTVGYWFVDNTGRSTCRVFYSCECKLRGWVPGPVYAVMTKEALKKATVWVSHESLKEYRESKSNQFGEAAVHFVENVRESLGALKLPELPQPPRLAARWMEERREQAVRFVSARRPPPQSSALSSSRIAKAPLL